MIINPSISGGSGGGKPGELSVSVASSTGLVTAEVTKGGTFEEGDSVTLQLSKQAAKTVTPSTSAQTAVSTGKYTTGAVKVAAKSAVTYKTGTFRAANKNTYTISGLTFKPLKIVAAAPPADITGRVTSIVDKSYTYESSGAQTTANGTTTFGTDSVTLTAPSSADFGTLLRYIIWG